MRIVIDLQGSQGASRYRGIGRYSLSIAQAIVRNKAEHEVIIVLNGLFPDSIEPIRALFDSILPQENIRVWYAAGPVNPLNPDNLWRRQAGELIRETFLASLDPDIILITSLFEGFGDDAIHSIGLMPKLLNTAVILYDLIPLIQSDQYLKPNLTYEEFYKEKLNYLKRTDLLLAISESSRQEAINHLAVSDNKVINIAAATDSNFKCIYISETDKDIIKKRFGINRPFLMYSGATDERKNHLRLIKAFSLLPPLLRDNYQLAIVGGLPQEHKTQFESQIKLCGLNLTDVVITDRVTDDEMTQLYNLCTLFVFPSWHEGFGLPVLEAMSCGAPVIGANTSSVPEVIGREDALFDPFDEKSIAKKITEVLNNDIFRTELAQYSLEQAQNFSWDKSALLTISAFERLYNKRQQTAKKAVQSIVRRPKLAFISPLPPERSGISDYSADLLFELSRHYEIEIISAQETISDSWINENCPVHTIDWFKKHSHQYERVLYQFGNSYFHQHMFELISLVPGVITLHDYYLSALMIHVLNNTHLNVGVRELYISHGYKALQEYHLENGHNIVVNKYPCNKTVLESALGVIVHTEHSKNLARQWINPHHADDWSVIPLLRKTKKTNSNQIEQARTALNIPKNSFLICSFGMLAYTKQNHRLLDAWLASSLSKDNQCMLIFVGKNDDNSAYGAALISTIRTSGFADRIHITDWIDTTKFHQYLIAADIGVQLRTNSRGETSAAVLDCMSYGLPTIVNANGSMANLCDDAVWMLPDEFDDADLIKALQALWKDKEKRKALGKRAREMILTHHAPRTCADQYAQAIENYYTQAQSNQGALIKAIAKIKKELTSEQEYLIVAQSIAQNLPLSTTKQLLVDVSALVIQDLKTGIQRVVRSILTELLNNPPEGFRVEPVYANAQESCYRYARQFTLRFLECPDQILIDEPVEALNGDIFLGLDLQPDIVSQQSRSYAHFRHLGVQVYFIIYDLLPVSLPQMFTMGSYAWFSTWLNVIAQMDGAICISQTVAEEMHEWLSINNPQRFRPFKLGWFHLGADMTSSVPTTGLPSNVDKVLATITSRATFLMVGTIEPRKGYLQTLSAFEQLWIQGINVNLVIVGNEGWKPLPDSERRTIPEIITKIKNHIELNHRLFWLEGISDEYLEKIYAASTCLIVASEGEGFGLPLIEAAQHKLPIIARDIPVFREIAGNNACYFSGLETTDLTSTIKEWLMLNKAGDVPRSDTMPWLTWNQSTQNLLKVVLNGEWYKYWMPDGSHQFYGSDSRLFTQVGKRNGRDMTSTGQAGHLIFGPYLPIGAGNYLVKIYGTFGEIGLSGAHMDIAVNKGELVPGESVLAKPDDNGCLVTLPISLDIAYSDFEVRIWVSEGCELCVQKIKVSHDDS